MTNEIYMLNHEDDFVQPGDPRFAKLYPEQDRKIRETGERVNDRQEEASKDDWEYEKKVEEQFGMEGKKVLGDIKKRNPELVKSPKL